MRRRFSPLAATLACASLMIGSLVIAAGAGPAQAASRTGKEHAAEPATAATRHEPKAAYSKAGPEDAAGCLTARKKLFVEGEGWIVRRVSTCR